MSKDIPKMDGLNERLREFFGDDQRSGGHDMSNDAGYAFAQDHAGEPGGMTAAQALTGLTRRGYSPGQADLALSRALARGSWDLARHAVSYDGETGTYRIKPVPWADGRTGREAFYETLEEAGQAGSGAYDLTRLRRIIETVDAYLDEAAPQWAKDCPEANMARRVGKAQLEAAEAMEELSLLTGENPRKGRHPEARERMLAELGDTAVAALLGIQSQVKNTDATWAVFLEALDKAMSRVPAESPFPPASGMTGQDAIDNGITG